MPKIHSPETPATRQYTVDKIVTYEETDESTRCRVRWYGYTAKEDILDPANYVPQHFSLHTGNAATAALADIETCINRSPLMPRNAQGNYRQAPA